MLSFIHGSGTEVLNKRVKENNYLGHKGNKVVVVNKRWAFRSQLIWWRTLIGGGFHVVRI